MSILRGKSGSFEEILSLFAIQLGDLELTVGVFFKKSEFLETLICNKVCFLARNRNKRGVMKMTPLLLCSSE